jgi:hypothetical protein
MSGILLASVGNSYGSLPVNIVAPAVTGTATVGQTLSTTDGTWTGAPAPTFSYQWQRNSVDISGATSSTYLLVEADFNNPIRCVVTATNPLGAVSANSNATANVAGTAPVNTVAPAISGSATVGSTLTTSNGTWTGTPTPTFAYQWQRVTTNISGATSSTYVVQLADVGNTIRCVVTATNVAGSVSANTANTASVPLPTVGSAVAGGFFAGQIGVSSVATHYLIVAPLSTGQSTLAWKNTRTATPGADSDINGPQNTADMVADGNSTVYPCAHFCNNAVIGGFSDWYMPAKNELEVCYFNLKPTTQSNNTSSGINPNAVPARASNYTSGNPAQTSAAAFQSGGAEPFAAAGYWSSTEFSASAARGQAFANGFQGSDYDTKNNSLRVRAVRRVAV